MRRKSEPVLTFEWNNDRVPEVVRQQREKYKQISRILDDQAVILDLVHEDLKTLSRDSGSGRRGREGDFTPETILRTLIVQVVEGQSLRDTVIRVAASDFCRTSSASENGPRWTSRFWTSACWRSGLRRGGG